MTKKIVIHPCRNQDEILKIALDYISDTPSVKCKCNGYHGGVGIMRNDNFVCYVQESKTSIIFRGTE